VNHEPSQEEQALTAQLELARERLDARVRDLRAVDDELAELSVEREQHRLLRQVCDSLDELERVGAARLFWGDRLSDGEVLEQRRLVQGRLDAFHEQVGVIEERRLALESEIRKEQDETEILEDALLEARQREEDRKLEWVVERDVPDLPGCARTMAWSGGGEDDARFRKALAATLLASILLGLLFPRIDLPLPDRWEPTEVPERLTRLVREVPPPPPPPPAQEQTRPEEKPEPSDERVAGETATPKSTPQESPKPSAASKGILAFREKFSGLADAEPADRLGSQARIRRDGEAAPGRPTRSMVTSQAPGSSGGINLASLSRDVGGGGGGELDGVQVARATSSIGGLTGDERPLSGGPGLGRTDEEIQIVFDRHKAALYRLYNRELRNDPTLRGQMVLRLRIEPDGSVSLCELQSSDMDAPQLASQVVGRVRTFDFGAKEVPPVTILYPIDFLPAT